MSRVFNFKLCYNISMDEQISQILQKLEEQDKKLDAIFRSSEKMRQYFLWTLIISVVVIVLPLLGIFALLPQFLSALGGGALGL